LHTSGQQEASHDFYAVCAFNPAVWLNMCACVGLMLLSFVQAVAAEAVDDEENVVMVSTAPEELRAELLAKRLATAGAIPNNLLASAGLNLPNRAIVSTTDTGAGF
jgi:hypothetical protein